MIKVSDYIFQYLAGLGIKHVFMISGGGAMHLVDSLGKEPKLTYICPHHEQTAAMAAEGYARTSGTMGVVVVTSGPGGTNTLTGVIGQWLDSVPVLYLSGQVKQQTTIESCRDIGLRQLGDQEINIVDIVKPVTKYAAFIRDGHKIRYHLDKAVYRANHGRPGPVWLDIPLDIQGAMIDGKGLEGYNPPPTPVTFSIEKVNDAIPKIFSRLNNAQRPLIIAGHGIRLAQAQDVFLTFIKKIGIPVVSTFSGMDLIPSDHNLYIGRIGTVGDRGGNYALQNSDFLLSLGSRNNIRQISYNWGFFARDAYKVVVDIDAPELRKPTLKPDMAVASDVKYFLEQMLKALGTKEGGYWESWIGWCHERRRRYPTVLPEYASLKKKVHPYYFIQVLTQMLPNDAVVVGANGSACVILFQVAEVKKGQRMFWNSGCAAMGYDLPAAIGACWARNKKDVVCLAGDGSLQMNIQELQTVFYHQLPIKLFVLNNQGYVSIKQTQDSFFNGHYVGCHKESGVSFPDVVKVARAYNIPACRIDSQKDLKGKLKNILERKGPVVCDVVLTPDYRFSPKLSSERKPDGRIVSKPLEDMAPFLTREELASNMIIPVLKD